MSASVLSAGAHAFTTAHGATITYFVTGNGPLVVLNVAPGWGPASVLYQNTFGFLEHDFTFVHIEPRGTRGSSFPPDLREMSSWRMAEDVEAVRQHLGIDVLEGVMGHSNGGTIALWHAIRFSGTTKTLVLVDAKARGLASISDPVTREMLAARPDRDAVDAFARWNPDNYDTDDEMAALMGSFLQLYLARPERDLAALQAGFDTKPQIACAKHQFAAEYQHDNQVPHLENVTARTLLIVGRQDFICPVVVSEFAAQRIPDASLVVIEDSGHMPFLEQPTQFGDAVRKFYNIAAR
ncbi:alpha/beta-hydrolase [Exidia glandulosa HHB12029]|uniref:Alpha/beta-hydrolase n=1 Tax=Exidia glandulosa HHB12029 TaxID=1314781 RepID=A0A165KPK3_EXIGL|nr:alpha/beta-hydrolase [Exidia glandulosa HHB12029]